MYPTMEAIECDKRLSNEFSNFELVSEGKECTLTSDVKMTLTSREVWSLEVREAAGKNSRKSQLPRSYCLLITSPMLV